MLPIAHRGCWWPHPGQQNTVGAMQQAASRGHAIEIDVHGVKRESEFESVQGMAVGHEVPEECDSGWPPFLGSYLDAFASAPLIFWNIKTSGLAQMLPEFISSHNLQDKSIIFDQDFAGMPKEYTQEFLETGLKVLFRLSDRPSGEMDADISGAHGVWLDQFRGDWVKADTIKRHKDKGYCVYIVSPELHNRVLNFAKWKEWVQAGADGICTDFPGFLEMLRTPYQDRSMLYPQGPWWQTEEWKATVAKSRK